jgi:hypothetical protein
MQFYSKSCELFNSASIENYNLYLENREKYMKLSNNSSSWDSDAHSETENLEYFKSWQTYYLNAITALVFQSMAVESYINYYGLVKLGKEIFDDKYEKSSTFPKLFRICKQVTTKDFPKDSDLYANLVVLFKKRNKLVHSKADVFDFKDFTIEKFQKSTEENITFVFDNLESLIEVYPKLKKELATLDGSHIDIVQQENQKMKENIEYCITNMFTRDQSLNEEDEIDIINFD